MSAQTGRFDTTDSDTLLGQSPALIAVLAHVLIWSLGPALVFGNLHSDTLEAAYWGRDLALGYAKHPPATTWLVDATLRLGVSPIASLMFLSQAGMAMASFFVWKSVRLYASAQTAGLAVLLFLLAPAATLYAVQLNHNSLLSPFWAATLYFCLAYLEERRWLHAIGLGIAAGLGMLVKYEIVLLLVPLVALAVIAPRFRSAFAQPASYVSIGLFFLILAPHVWWLEANNWPSAARAMGAEKMRNVATLNLSAVNAIVGLFALFFVPVALLFATLGRRVSDDIARGPDLSLIALVIAFGPPATLVASSVATLQIVKPLWVLPLASSVAVGLALMFPAGSGGLGFGERASARLLMALSALLFAAFVGYLIVAGALGKPLAAFAADARKLSVEIERVWGARQTGPLRCVVISDRKIGASGVLFVPGRPDFVDFSSPSWSTPRQIGECRRSGAIAALTEASSALDHCPAACRADVTRFEVSPLPGMGKAKWPVELVYIPPEAAAGCAAPAR